jgi:hypothetical protein
VPLVQTLFAWHIFPLVVLIPCWWGFFDKAKTITRIVGYIRILEGILLDLVRITSSDGNVPEKRKRKGRSAHL